ncbi:MAG: PAS domain-containing protein [Xanthomonadales bacterium]|nr:PAS domain-containing protein [Xanthomonadales bacterium]
MSAEMEPTLVEQARNTGLLDALLDVSGLLVVVLDDKGRIQLFNRACEELTGFMADDLLGEPIWSKLIPEDELPDVRQVHGRLREKRESTNTYVNHWLTRGGKKRLIQWRNTSLRDEEGRVLGFVGTGIDVTEQKRALKAQWHWEHERHYLLDALPMLIAHVGSDFRVRLANEGYRQWFGVNPADMVGEPIADVIGESAFGVLEPYFRSALSGQRAVYHGRLKYRFGPTRFIHGSYIPAFDEDERTDGFYIVSVDLSEQQRLRETLDEERARARQEAQAHLLELSHATRVAALGEVTSGLAHEISQPLTAISASAEACLMRLDADPDSGQALRPALEKIATQGQRARQIVDQLRAFLRKEQEDSRVLCAPEELVDHVLLLLEPELDAAGIEVVKEVAPGLTRLRVNRVQMEQVLFNLVRNAIDALKDWDGERRIHILCAHGSNEDECCFEVSDSGPGLAESYMPRLFHPFYTTKREGLGQGLSICRSIVERHDGKIRGENHPQGGAVFSFTLPIGGSGDE